MRALLAILALTTVASQAQAAPPKAIAASPDVATRARELVDYLNGQGDFESFFAPVFRAAITPAQMQPVVAQLTGLYGKATGIESITPSSGWTAMLRIAYERGVVIAQIGVDPAAPHQVSGLRITGSEVRDDALEKLDADFAKLPGKSGFGIYALGSGAPEAVHELNGDRPMPLGSAFKLWVLAEAARQVAAGERRWSDVVPVGTPSLASGILQSWPAGTPMTLQALATLMISISDNTATDTLIGVLGRDRVDAMVAQVGTAEPARTLPVLTTREMFVLKSKPGADLAAKWAGAGPEARRALLAANAARIAGAPLDPMMFNAGPVLTDTIEWFASARDEARALDWLRLHGGETALAILAVSPGVSDAMRAEVGYIGYKGGSEPGVIALNYLVRSKAGRWFAVTANWHRPDGEVEPLTFDSLVGRALRLAVR